MPFVEDLRRYNLGGVILVAFAFLAVVSSGFLIIQHYHPDYIQHLDVVKLILFASSLTLPIFLVNFVAALRPCGRGPQDPAPILAACIMTFVATYAPLFLSYLSRMPFRVFALLVGLIEAAFVVAMISFGKNSAKPDGPDNETPG
jgi:hypothetical protein